MTPTALADLELTLSSLRESETFDPLAEDEALDEFTIRSTSVVPLTSDFATMGGSRPRTMF